MKPLVIYHGGCMDGAAAALAAWLKFGEDAEYRPAQYGDAAPTDEEVRGRDVYVLDFSYPRAELERMDKAVLTISPEDYDPSVSSGQLHVLDHHKSAQADLAGLPFCTFDMSKSGAVLAWEHFHQRPIVTKNGGVTITQHTEMDNPLPELFAYVQDRDLWRWELPHSREVSAALGASGALTDFRKLKPYLNWKGEGDGHRTLWTKCVDDGAAILRAERLMVERVVASAEEVEIKYLEGAWSYPGSKQVGGNECMIRALAATSAVLQSEVGEALALESARRGRDAVGAVYYRDGKAGKWRVSLRSRDFPDAVLTLPDGRGPTTVKGAPAPDVSAVAKSFGGGGHARAAGFECKILPWQEEPQ